MRIAVKQSCKEDIFEAIRRKYIGTSKNYHLDEANGQNSKYHRSFSHLRD